ncbi:MAG: DUF123 domain-containing protein [Methanomicrobiales archaeon]|nr:DUF123 domain-containing protein [Methanomicrobiales archaeon]
MDKGVYILLLENEEIILQIGSLGRIIFQKGWHAYVGSALGPGGFARVKRHLLLHQEKNKKPRWHIDYLLLCQVFKLQSVYCIPTSNKIECLLAGKMQGAPVQNFGSSDCNCISHLFYYPKNPHSSFLKLTQELSEKENPDTKPWIFYTGKSIRRFKGIV